MAVLCAGAANRVATEDRTRERVTHALELGKRSNARWKGVVDRVVREQEPPRMVVELREAISAQGHVPFSTLAIINLPPGIGLPREGETVLFRAPLHAPRVSRFPGDYDAAVHLASRGIELQGSVPERGDLTVLEGPLAVERNLVSILLDRARNTTLDLVRQTLPEDAAAITEAFVLGDAPTMTPELRQPFDAAGAAHLLAVSGLQATLLASLLFALIRWLWGRSAWLMRLSDPGPTAALLCIPAIFIYAAYAGGAASVLRSAWMAAAAMLGVWWRRPGSVAQTLGFAALVMLAMEPRSLHDVGFLLSFLSVLSLALLAPGMAQVLEPGGHAPSWRTWIMAAIASSATAWIATTPLTAHLFGRIAIYGALTNVLLVPLGGLVLPAVVVLVIGGTALNLPLLIGIAGALGLAIKDICAVLARLPYALVEIPPPPLYAVALSLVGALLLAVGTRRAVVAGMALVAGSCVLGFVPEHPDDHALRVLMAPVGQGDGMILRLPSGEVAVVDAGGSWRDSDDPGATVIAPILRRLGVKQLRLVVASHPHPDHQNGLPSLVREFRAQEVWTNGQPSGHPRFADLMRAAQEVGAKLHVFTRDPGQPWAIRDIGGATFTVLHPFPVRDAPDAPFHFPEFGTNDNSLVIRVSLGNTSILLPGDIEHEAEQILLHGDPRVRAALKTDILKVPHHGSITASSEELLDAVAPHVALLGVGSGNIWNFPNPEVMRRYAQRRVDVWRTDQDGLITAVLDGDTVSVTAFRRSW